MIYFIKIWSVFSVFFKLSQQFQKFQFVPTIIIKVLGFFYVCTYEIDSWCFSVEFNNSIKALYEAYGQLFDSYDDFVEKFQGITKERFTCMIYKADIDELEDNYVSFKAVENIPNYKLKYKI